MNKSYKFRIKPNKTQQTLIRKTCGCTRFIWNELLAESKRQGKPFYNTTAIRNDERFEWLKEVSAAALQQKARDFKQTYDQFFKGLKGQRKTKIEEPKFKKKSYSESYRLPNQKFKLNQDKKYIQLEKIGKVKIKLDRKIPADVKYLSVSVSFTATDEFYVSICLEENIKEHDKTGSLIGIDLGMKDLAVLSNGKVCKNPKFFKQLKNKLASAQKHLSNKKRGSNGYHKQRLKVAKIHQKIARKRSHHLHEVSSEIVKNHDTICLEDLNVKGMIGFIGGRSVNDTALSELTRQLMYKSQWYGKETVKINRFYPSSKTHYECGYIYQNLSLSEREWKCQGCGGMVDRDLNAAKNILREGLRILSSP